MWKIKTQLKSCFFWCCIDNAALSHFFFLQHSCLCTAPLINWCFLVNEISNPLKASTIPQKPKYASKALLQRFPVSMCLWYFIVQAEGIMISKDVAKALLSKDWCTKRWSNANYLIYAPIMAIVFHITGSQN